MDVCSAKLEKPKIFDEVSFEVANRRQILQLFFGEVGFTQLIKPLFQPAEKILQRNPQLSRALIPVTPLKSIAYPSSRCLMKNSLHHGELVKIGVT